MCQSDGYCSFPDDTCPSGQRYGEHAGDGKQHDCVAGDDGPTSEGDTGGVTATSNADDATTLTTGSSSSVSASSATGGSDDDGDASTTGALTEPTDPTDASDSFATSSGETTEGPPLDCSIDDAFDGPALDMAMWGSWGSDENVTVVQTDGVVRFTIGAGGAGIGGLITVPAISVAESMVTVTVGTPPDASTTVEQSFIVQGGGGASVRVVLNDGIVQVVVWDGVDNIVPYSEPHDVQPGDRFRFTVTGDELTVAMSLGQANWAELSSGPPPFDVGDVQVVARALSYENLAAPTSVEVEAISVCAL